MTGSADIRYIEKPIAEIAQKSFGLLGRQYAQCLKKCYLCGCYEKVFLIVYHPGVPGTDGLSAGCPLVVGIMRSRSGGRGNALFICVADDPYNENHREYTLGFTSKSRKVKAWGGDGPIALKRCDGGRFEVPVASNQGLILEF